MQPYSPTNPKLKVILGLVLVIHCVLTWLAFVDHGFAGFFPPFAASNTTQIFSDLLISISLVNVWVFFDLKRHGKPMRWFALHLLGTVVSGSFAPLIYLLVRDNLLARNANTSAQPRSKS